MLGRYPVCNDMAWQMNPMRKAFHWNAPQIVFCSMCNALYPPYTFLQYYSFVSNCAACEMYISWWFLYTSATWEGYICLDIHIFTSFLSAYVSYRWWVHVIWHGRWCPLSPLGGISLICSKNYFLQYVYFCISPKTFFQHHEFGGNCKPYNMYITLWLLYKFSCIHAYICLHFDIFTYFLSWNAWCRLWMQRYGMTDKPPSYLTEGYSNTFHQVDIMLRIWHRMKLTFMSDVWVLLHFWAYFTTFGCTISYSSYIYHYFIHMCYLSFTSLSNIECNHGHCNSSLWHLFALNISVIVHFNFHSLYMLCLSSTYGS